MLSLKVSLASAILTFVLFKGGHVYGISSTLNRSTFTNRWVVWDNSKFSGGNVNCVGIDKMINRKLIILLLMISTILLLLPLQYGEAIITPGLTDKERYDTGYSWGCSDAKKGGHPYLDSHPTHTPVFMRGYNEGYRNCSTQSFNLTPVPNQAPSQKTNQKQDFRTVCQYIQNYLVNSCSVYVKPDGTLTKKGTVAHNCIISGGLLTLIGSYGFKIPPSAIRGYLEPLSVSSGCGGIVDWNDLERDLTGLLSALSTLRSLGLL